MEAFEGKQTEDYLIYEYIYIYICWCCTNKNNKAKKAPFSAHTRLRGGWINSGHHGFLTSLQCCVTWELLLLLLLCSCGYSDIAFIEQVPVRSKIVTDDTVFERVNTFTYLECKI
jgi:hypothetical protein